MTLNVTSVGDNAFVPGVVAQSYNPDQLVGGNLKQVTQPIVLASGTLKRGAVLGQQTSFSAIVTPGTNTGNGSVGSVTLGNAYELMSYVLTAISATSFSVVDPEGVSLGNATVGTAFTNAEINFTITAGGTAFVAGDSFVISVKNGIGNFILCVKTASDGSQTPVAILADDADASSGPVTAGAYVMGEFNGHALNYDTSWSIQALASALRPYSLFVKLTALGLTNLDPS